MSCSPCYRDCQIHTKTPVAQGPESCGRHHIQLLRETTAGYALEPLLDRRSSAVSPTTSQGHVMKPVDMLHPIAPDRPEDALSSPTLGLTSMCPQSPRENTAWSTSRKPSSSCISFVEAQSSQAEESHPSQNVMKKHNALFFVSVCTSLADLPGYKAQPHGSVHRMFFLLRAKHMVDVYYQSYQHRRPCHDGRAITAWLKRSHACREK